MSRSRPSLGRGLLASAVAAGTVWVTMLGWRPLTEDAAEFVGPLFLAAGLTALTGGLARWARLPVLLVALLQVLVVGAFVLGVVTGSALPTSENVEAFVAALMDGVASANQYQAPVPTEAAPVIPIFVLAGAAGMVLVDLVAVSLDRVAASGLLLMALYSVPVSISASGVAWWLFALGAAGFLLLLYLQQDDSVSRWGRGAGVGGEDDPSGFGVRTGAARTSALAIGAGTTALAVVLPALLPTLSLGVWDGPAGGGGGGGISIDNPLVDMRRDLSRGEDEPMLRVRTDGERPTYLRLSVLNRFNGEEWSSGDREVPTDQIARGEMPAPLGVGSELSRTETRYQFEASPRFRSQWLPTMPHVAQINAPGDWRYDRATMDFIAGDQDATTAGLTWSQRALDLEYDLASLDSASSGASQVGSSMVQVPANLPGIVRSLTESVTGSQPTRFRKARALQDWFRSEFTYNAARVDSVGSSELAAFLDPGGREGYCEQFAASMAIMARLLDIPARVAVGFLEPTEVGPGIWEFSSHDLHAWPELFFPGSGWVRFEPTPSRARQVPGYTQNELPQIEETDRPAVPQSSEDLPNRGPSDDAAPQEAEDESEDSGSGIPWGPVLGGGAALLVLLVAALGPRVLRSRRRQDRLRDGGVEPLWDELRDHCLDLGRPWPTGRSPRATADVVAGWFGAPGSLERPGTGPEHDPEAVEALGRLVLALERWRYGPAGSVPANDPARVDDLERCTAALTAGTGPHRRRRATWWPVSLLRRPVERGPVGLVGGRPGTVDHVG